MQSSGRSIGQYGSENIERGGIGVRAVRSLVHRDNNLHVPDTLDGHSSLAVLDRLDCIGSLQLSGWPGNLREVLRDQSDCLRLFNLARYHQNSVIGLIILLVEILEL